MKASDALAGRCARGFEARWARGADDGEKSDHCEYDRVESYDRVRCNVANDDDSARGINSDDRREKSVHASVHSGSCDEKNYQSYAERCRNVARVFSARTNISGWRRHPGRRLGWKFALSGQLRSHDEDKRKVRTTMICLVAS
jgi:hypothetical protein